MIQFRIVAALLFSAMFAGCMAVNDQRANNTPELERTVRQTPEELAIGRAKAATELAAGWFQRGQYATALEELGNAVKSQPTFAPAHGLFGLVYHTLKDDVKAEESFKIALNLSPTDPQIRTNYGWFLCRTQREIESILEFEKAADNTLYRTPELSLQYAAQCAARANRMQVAETFYKRMAAVVPDSALPYFGLVEITYRVGRYNDTRNHLKIATRSQLVPASVLHIAYCAETRLGDLASASAYLAQLKNRFPSAVETIRATSGECE